MKMPRVIRLIPIPREARAQLKCLGYAGLEPNVAVLEKVLSSMTDFLVDS